MKELDEIARLNQANWEQRVRNGASATIPELDLDTAAFREFAEGKRERLPGSWGKEAADQIVMRQAPGKDVLCLASGGGSQSVAFGLLGARVTVLDLCEGQLAGDRKAAEHYGYDVRTVQGDMRDLSVFDDESFDIVYQGISIVFAPYVREVYREVARVLRPQGWYCVIHLNPAGYPTCFDGPPNGWDGVGYRITEPYRGGPVLVRQDGSENMSEGQLTGEFRHLLCDIFNGLVETGLAIKGVWEADCHLNHDPTAEPGSERHRLNIIGEYFFVLTQKD